MSESKLQQACIAICKERGIYYSNNHGGGYAGKGRPDLFLCIDGKFVAVELKVKNNQLEPPQILHRDRILRSGGQHYVCRTVEEFEGIL